MLEITQFLLAVLLCALLALLKCHLLRILSSINKQIDGHHRRVKPLLLWRGLTHSVPGLKLCKGGSTKHGYNK